MISILHYTLSSITNQDLSVWIRTEINKIVYHVDQQFHNVADFILKMIDKNTHSHKMLLREYF